MLELRRRKSSLPRAPLDSAIVATLAVAGCHRWSAACSLFLFRRTNSSCPNKRRSSMRRRAASIVARLRGAARGERRPKAGLHVSPFGLVSLLAQASMSRPLASSASSRPRLCAKASTDGDGGTIVSHVSARSRSEGCDLVTLMSIEGDRNARGQSPSQACTPRTPGVFRTQMERVRSSGHPFAFVLASGSTLFAAATRVVPGPSIVGRADGIVAPYKLRGKRTIYKKRNPCSATPSAFA
jgi:hypothetical protein